MINDSQNVSINNNDLSRPEGGRNYSLKDKSIPSNLTDRKKAALIKTLSNYGSTLEEYENLLKSQNFGCGICKKHGVKQRLFVDHDHLTSEIRGLLCNKCNSGLGLFLDSPGLLIQAAYYLLRNHKKRLRHFMGER